MNPFHPLANPEAGSHPLPEDHLEIEAALRAGQSSWDNCPYYEFRYAERGRLFARSDSGYLVLLTQQDSVQVQEQVDWLARVLACRGMPTWLLEQHLYVLFKELCFANHERQADYKKLRDAADTLKKRRIARIDRKQWHRLGEHFHHQIAHDPWLTKLRDPGGLLLAAVADEANGLQEAVPSLLSWLTDCQRFSTAWIAAVDRSLAMVRAAVTT